MNMAHSSRMMMSLQQIAEEAEAAALHRTLPHIHPSPPYRLKPPQVSVHAPADAAAFAQLEPLVKHDMENHSVDTTQHQALETYSSQKEPDEENQTAIVSSGSTYIAPGIVMRSLSNKVRLYSDDASMDEMDSGRGPPNIDAQDEYRHTASKLTRLSEQEWQTMAKFAKAQGQDLMKQVEEQKRSHMAEHKIGDPPSPDNIAKSEMDEMRRILKEGNPRDSEEYFMNIPTESERDSSPERVPRRKRHHHHRHRHHNVEAERVYPDKHLHMDYDTSSSHTRGSSFMSSDINGDLKSLATEDPSKVLDWLRGYGGAEPDKRIVLSEDRILNLLQALREGAFSGIEGLTQQENAWVPMERLREAERKSSAAEEQIRYFEQLFNMGEGSETTNMEQEEQLRTVLMKSKTMDRHFAHMKKFAEDRHAELRRMYSNVSDKDVKTTWRANTISPSRSGLVSVEKAKKELQEHENHKRRLVQVFSSYNELLRLVKVEHAKRIDAENKSFQLTSQLKRQTATLKRAEKVIKHTALSPIVFNEPHSFNQRAPADFANSDRNSMQASPVFSPPSTPLADSRAFTSGPHSHTNLGRNYTDGEASNATSPLHSNSPNNTGKITIRTSSNSSPSPTNQTISKQLTYDVALDHIPSSRDGVSHVPHLRLPTSALVDQDHRKEFRELENALIEEGRSKGFADVDLYSEKKTVGKEETCWEYRHVHFDFTKPNQEAAPAASVNEERKLSSPVSSTEALDIACVSNLPVSRRTASPGRSEGSSFLEEKCEDLQQSATDGHDLHLLSSLASYREGLERLHKQEDSKQGSSTLKLDGGSSSSASSPLRLDHSYPASAASSPLKLDSEVFSIPEMKSAEERRRLEAAALKNSSESEVVAQKARDDVAKNDGVAAKSDLVEPKERSPDDVAETTLSEVAHNKNLSPAEADVAENMEMLMEPKGHVSVKQLRGGHVSSKHKSTDDLQRRVAIIEAGNVAHLLHRQVKRRRRLLLIQVAFFGVALMWGVLPSSLPPPT